MLERITGRIDSPERILLGEVVVPEGVTKHVANYQTASWWTDEALTPGTYPVTTNGYYVFLEVPSVVTDAYFPSSYGGVPFGGTNGDYHVGNASAWHADRYLYEIAAALARCESEWCGFSFEPVDGILVKGRKLAADSTYTYYDLYREAA